MTLPIISGVDQWDPAIVPMPLGDPDAVDLKSLRVALHTDNGIKTPTAETIDAVNRAAAALADIGVPVEEQLPEAIQDSARLANQLSAADGRAWVRRILQRQGTTEIHSWLQKRIDDAEPLKIEEFTALLEEVDRFRSAMHTFMQDYDVILCPYAPSPPSPTGPHWTTRCVWASATREPTTSPDGPARLCAAERLPRVCPSASRWWRVPGVRMWPWPLPNSWRRPWGAGSDPLSSRVGPGVHRTSVTGLAHVRGLPERNPASIHASLRSLMTKTLLVCRPHTTTIPLPIFGLPRSKSARYRNLSNGLDPSLRSG